MPEETECWPSLLEGFDPDRSEAITREVNRLYTDAVVQRIAATLPRFVDREVRARFPEEIRIWAGGYLALKDAFPNWLKQLQRTKSLRSGAEKRKAETGVSPSALSLGNTIKPQGGTQHAGMTRISHLRSSMGSDEPGSIL